ncbi:NUDIX domain-containing protein [Candidatus Dojkabacteria bacterium]|nr:NUDIX domain-containing protein [Candidatus Dojkabacteria bacterium]
MSNTNLISISEACEILNVHPNTLKRWEIEGLVNPIRFGKRGDRKYKKQEIDSLINDSRKFNKPYGTDYPKVTVVAVIMYKGKVLLGKRNRKLKHGFYALPGGYLSTYEKLDDAIIKEVKEETQLNLNKPEYIGIVESIEQDEKIHTINVGYLLRLENLPGSIETNDEVDEWEWFSIENLPDKMIEADKEMIKKCQS